MDLTKLKSIINNKNLVLVFPGQASQYKQMGINWYNSFSRFKEVFDYINQKLIQDYKDYIDSDLFSILENEEKINITLYSQISIFAVSVSCFETIKDLFENVVCFTGHSLGEYSALVCANSLTLDQGIDLVVKRGYFMHNYSKNGTMFAVIYQFNYDTIQKLEEIVQKNFSVIANYNSYNQLIISAPLENSENLKEEIKKEFNNAKIIPLKVSGAFHSYLVKEANEHMKKEIDKINFLEPCKPVFLNLDSRGYLKGSEIKEAMKGQMVSPVKWIQTVENIYNSYENIIFLEILPNKVLTNLVRKGFNTSISNTFFAIEELFSC